MKKSRPRTPDGRYFVAREELRRCTDPRLADGERRRLIKQLMQARIGFRNAATDQEAASAREAIDRAKTELGERGPVWWEDGAPDYSGQHPLDTPYAVWWRSTTDDDEFDD